MSNGDAFKLVRDFQSSAQQGQGDFSLVYADLVDMRSGARNPQQLHQELSQANTQLINDGAIPMQNGLPEFIIVGADSSGHIITADPSSRILQERGLDMQVINTEQLPYGSGNPGDGQQSNGNSGGQPNNGNPGDGQSYNGNSGGQPYNGNPGDGQPCNGNPGGQPYSGNPSDGQSYNGNPGGQPNGNPGDGQPSNGNPGGQPYNGNPYNGGGQYDQPSTPGSDNGAANNGNGDAGQSGPAQPTTENWHGRNFTVNPDGSAQYTVVSGDTVSAVADDVLHQRLGQTPTQQQIMNEVGLIASASALSNANLIYPGNILVIPAANGDYVPVDNMAGNQPDNTAVSQPTTTTQNPLATTYSGASTAGGNIDGDAKADLGQKMWTNFNGTDNGELGCAASVSEVLQQAQYPYASSAGVYELQQQLTSNGWQQTSQPQPGDVVCGYRTDPSDSGGGGAHTGIVGPNSTVFNNSSDTGTWSQTALSDFNTSEYPSGVFYFQPPTQSA